MFIQGELIYQCEKFLWYYLKFTLYRTNLNWEKLKGYPAANPELSFDQLKLYLDGSLKNIPIQIAN